MVLIKTSNVRMTEDSFKENEFARRDTPLRMGCCLRGCVTCWHGSKRWRLEKGRLHLPVLELRRVRVKHQVSTAESCCNGATTDILRKTCRTQIHQVKSFINVKAPGSAACSQCNDLRVASPCWYEVPSIVVRRQ